MTSSISLTLTQANNQSTQYTFDQSATIGIGRSQNNEVAIPTDTSLSREHCEVAYQHGRWYLEDLGSKNGTFLENKTAPGVISRVRGRIVLVDGQRIRIGRTWLAFSVALGPART